MDDDNEYYGSEKHFRDIQTKAEKSFYIENPQALSDFSFNFCLAVKELLSAIGFYSFFHKSLILTGRMLQKIGFNNGK